MMANCNRTTVAAGLLAFVAATRLLLPPAGAAAELTIPHASTTLRVAVVGDIGDGTADIAPGIARVQAATPLDGILITGDNFYPCGVRSLSDPLWARVKPLAAIGPPLYPVLGNHDYCGNINAQIGAPLWHMPAREYALRGGVADFAMIDTTPQALGSSRSSEATIVSLLHGSKAPWRIVVGHHVIHSSGYHGFFRFAERHRMERYLPILRRERVDLYVCGHDHHMELLMDKPLLLISGAGSEPVPALALKPSTLYPSVVRRGLGFSVLTIETHHLTITFYDGAGKQDGPPFTFTH